MADIEENELVALTAEIVSAYVVNNPLPPADLAELISTVSASLRRLGEPASPPEPELVPAVNPKKSVFPDYIVCLEDGKKFKSMKRHLSSHGLTPEQYRAKWGLPADYPMTAPNYSAARSAMAKDIGLGRKPVAKPVAKTTAKSVAKPAARRRKTA